MSEKKQVQKYSLTLIAFCQIVVGIMWLTFCNKIYVKYRISNIWMALLNIVGLLFIGYVVKRYMGDKIQSLENRILGDVNSSASKYFGRILLLTLLVMLWLLMMG